MTKSCVNDFESKLSSFGLQIFVSIESNQKDFPLISRLQFPFSTYKCCLWTHEKTRTNCYRDLSINIPTRILPPVNAGNFPEALLRAVRLEAQYCYTPKFFTKASPKNGFGSSQGRRGIFSYSFFGLKKNSGESAVQLWEGTIFFRHFLKELKVRKA